MRKMVRLLYNTQQGERLPYRPTPWTPEQMGESLIICYKGFRNDLVGI